MTCVGSQILCASTAATSIRRRATVETNSCLVLPETDAEEAERVALRVWSRVHDDTEHPPIAVSVGTAVYPRDDDQRNS